MKPQSPIAILAMNVFQIDMASSGLLPMNNLV